MNFQTLIDQFQQTDQVLRARTVTTINQHLILRNWLFGMYIVEFEQHGKDYAQYGEQLLNRLAKELKKKGLKGVAYTNLTLFRKFYLYYPQIRNALPDIQGMSLPDSNLQALPEDSGNDHLPATKLLSKLSFTHFVELLKVEDPRKRLFYEVEIMKGNWSYRQLRRQIGSLLFERTGLSTNQAGLLAQLTEPPSQTKAEELIRDPYVFEFLGLKEKEVFREKDLESALLDHLQAFLLELGSGFCFEARQKTFLIDNRRYKIDLLFYHRVLKCHILIDFKLGEFTHEDAGQMNFYLNYIADNEMHPEDRPPVGIILCTYKHEAVVKYATGGLDQQLFVSRYLLELPTEESLQQWVLEEQQRLQIDQES